jgi:hypothetical protein
MMGIITSTSFTIYKIHVIDQNEKTHYLESTYYNFEDERSMGVKWHELNNENHYHISLLKQEIYTASAFHT